MLHINTITTTTPKTKKKKSQSRNRTAKKTDENENLSSNEPSIRFKNGVPYHSVDLSASCPRCLAAAAEKPGSEGEFDITKNDCLFQFVGYANQRWSIKPIAGLI